MAPLRLAALIALTFVTTSLATDCVDLISACANLQSICIGSILEYHFNVIDDLSTQVNSSSIPALESSLPLLESDLPLVLAANDGSSTTVSDRSTEEASAAGSTTEDPLKSALPLLKESLPLIRESLPLIRESLPLIRQYLDPLVGKPDCQRKATCRSCKECPKLRDSIISFVQSLCPNTCKVCTTAENANTTATGISAFFG
ncbi:unnamed protein product [Caenorhabditis sp. 36 PRJEB53466]|nr:unnamed protein product [Caenorhabditis sp. 36 PRJEB53466]